MFTCSGGDIDNRSLNRKKKKNGNMELSLMQLYGIDAF